MNRLVLVFIFCLAQQTLVECKLRRVVDVITHTNDSFARIQIVITDKLLALKNRVHSLVEQGLDVVKKKGKAIVDRGLQLRLNSTHLIQTAVDETEKETFSIVDGAIKNGKNASHCIRKVSSRHIQDIIMEMTSCVERKIAHCRHYIKEGIKRIKDLLYISKKFDRDVKGCGVGLLSIGCIGIVLSKVAVESAIITGKVTHLIKDVIGSIAIVKGRLLICKIFALASSAILLAKFTSRTAICIEKSVRVNIEAEFDSNGATTTTDMTTDMTTETTTEIS